VSRIRHCTGDPAGPGGVSNLERLTAFQIELGNRHGIDGFAYGFKYLPLTAELTPAEAPRA
jgi:hypothetical protein